MQEILTSVGGITDIIAAGGNKAIIFILITNFVIALVVSYIVIRFLFKFIKEHNDSKDKILSEKDEIIISRTVKMENLIDQYNRLALQNLEKDNTIITMIND